MSKYVIVDAEAIQKRIEELEVLKIIHSYKGSYPNLEEFTRHSTEQRSLKQILSQSTPLIPEIEKAFDAGQFEEYKDMSFDGGENYETVRIIMEKQEYITNLKLDI